MEDVLGRLSQGEKQLLSLARVMIFGHKIVILDEATGWREFHQVAKIRFVHKPLAQLIASMMLDQNEIN
jgi:ABC-type uncharacterized transport system fused permease/ATPase subunit